MLIRTDSRHMRPLAMVCALCLICFLLADRTIFAKTEQPETHDPLVTTLGTRALDVEYQLWYYVNVVFESEVTQTADGYEYRYRLTNKGDTQVRGQWRALEESAFGVDSNFHVFYYWAMILTSSGPWAIGRPSYTFTIHMCQLYRKI